MKSSLLSPSPSRPPTRLTATVASVAIATLLTATLAAEWEWQIDEVAAADVAGHRLAFSPDGTPTIAYSLFSAEEVRFATRAPDGAWSSESVDRGRQYYNGLSLAYRADGQPGISYGFGPIRIAERTEQGWTRQTVFKGAASTNNTSLVYRGNVPHISFSAGGGKSYLVLAHRPASKWTVETVDKAGGGAHSSLAFDSLNRAVIAYAASSNNQVFNVLKLAVRSTSGVWTTSAIESGTTGFGVHAALAFSGSGRPVIVHGSGTVRVLEFVGDWAAGSGTWAPVELDPGPFAGGASIAFDGEDPIVAWRQTDGDPHPTILKIARRVSGAWITDEMTRFEPPVNWIGTTELATHDGRPAVSFTPQSSSVWNLLFAQARPLP